MDELYMIEIKEELANILQIIFKHFNTMGYIKVIE